MKPRTVVELIFAVTYIAGLWFYLKDTLEVTAVLLMAFGAICLSIAAIENKWKFWDRS